MSDEAREKGRAAIYGMAGLYLLYLSYSIFKGRAESSGMEFTIIMIAMAGFVAAGIGLIVYSVRMMDRIRRRDQEEAKQEDDSSNE